MKTPDFGIVLRVTLNYMQRVRVPVYTHHPQSLVFVTLYMYLWVWKKKFSVFPDTNYPQTRVLPASQLFRSELWERET